MRVRTLKAMNNLNLMLMIHMGHISMLIEDIDKKLLTIKIIESMNIIFVLFFIINILYLKFFILSKSI